MKIILIHPPWQRLFDFELSEALLGLGYIAGVLEKNGYKPVIYNADFNYNKGNNITNLDYFLKHENYMNILNDINHPIWNEVKEKIESLNPDVVGITSMTANFKSALNVASIIKQWNANVPVVLGGHHPTAVPESVLKYNDVDIIVRGEGEITFLELVKALETKNDLKNVLGISYRKNGVIVHNPDRPLIPDLDTIPFPAKHLMLDVKEYPSNGFGLLIGSRGCPHNCIFCASKLMWGRKTRFRSPRNIVDEMKRTKELFETNTFKFVDDTLTINKAFITELCNLLIQEKLNIKWSCMSVVSNLDENILQKMRKAGCYSVSIGIETGDPETMLKLKKGITLEMVEKAVTLLKKHGFMVGGYVMYGFPWETKEYVYRTVQFIEKLDLDSIGYSIATPLPGTELLKIVQEEGLLPETSLIDWEPMHQGSPEMFFSNKISKDDARRIVLDAENKFYDQVNIKNKQRLRRKLYHPGELVQDFFAWGYHRDLKKLMRKIRQLM